MILITGGSGQLGDALQQLCTAQGLAFKAVSRPEFDFETPETIATCFNAAKPNLVINAAAYTAVDKAETDIAAADAGNHTGPLALAKLCETAGIPFIHVSTDYVFDGNKGAPYVETDPTNPTGIYGATKRDGEAAILATNAHAVILRTAWVYGAHGKNFARTMLGAGRKMPLLRVVADQRGTPTTAADLAAAILGAAAKIRETGWQPEYRGVFHATGADETTWYGFAKAVIEGAGLAPSPKISPITTPEYPTPAIRPVNSVLDCSRIRQEFEIFQPSWRDALSQVLAEVKMGGHASGGA